MLSPENELAFPITLEVLVAIKVKVLVLNV
jgi:hypothetical protein